MIEMQSKERGGTRVAIVRTGLDHYGALNDLACAGLLDRRAEHHAAGLLHDNDVLRRELALARGQLESQQAVNRAYQAERIAALEARVNARESRITGYVFCLGVLIGVMLAMLVGTIALYY